MSEREQSIRDIEEYMVRFRRCHEDMENMLDSLRESFDKLFSRFDIYFGKELKS